MRVVPSDLVLDCSIIMKLAPVVFLMPAIFLEICRQLFSLSFLSLNGPDTFFALPMVVCCDVWHQGWPTYRLELTEID